MGEQTECDKLQNNNIVVNSIDMERSMINETYQQLEINQSGMKVILEFPQQAENEESIKKEVKSVLISILHEQMRKCGLGKQFPSQGERSGC